MWSHAARAAFARRPASRAAATELAAGPKLCEGDWVCDKAIQNESEWGPGTCVYRVCSAVTGGVAELYEWRATDGAWQPGRLLLPQGTSHLVPAEVWLARGPEGEVTLTHFLGTRSNAWTGSLRRLRLGTATMAGATTRQLRKALLRHKHGEALRGPPPRAGAMARKVEWDGNAPWAEVWKSGWAAAWPAKTRDTWWGLAAGVAYTASRRRWDDENDSVCMSCENGCDSMTHMVEQCPEYAQLWAFGARALRAADVDTYSDEVPATLLYGGATDGPTSVQTLIRGAVIHAWGIARAARNRPEDKHGLTGAAMVKAARSELRRMVLLDYRSATRPVHARRPAVGGTVHERPHSKQAWADKWRRVAGIRRTGRRRDLQLWV